MCTSVPDSCVNTLAYLITVCCNVGNLRNSFYIINCANKHILVTRQRFKLVVFISVALNICLVTGKGLQHKLRT